MSIEKIFRKLANGDDDEGGKSPSTDRVAHFLKENPNPSDAQFHEWAEAHGFNVHRAEEKVYRLASIMAKTSGVNLVGKADKEGLTESQVCPRELKKGIKVELEHTSDRGLAKQIALDHLAELPDYYTRLEKMEREGEKDKEAMPFLEQNRSDKVKEIYSALKRDHPDMPAEMKARIAARRGKKNAMSRKSPKDGGPKYKAPLGPGWKEKKSASLKERLLTSAIMAPTSAAGFAATAAPEQTNLKNVAMAALGGGLAGLVDPPSFASMRVRPLMGLGAGAGAGGILRIPVLREGMRKAQEAKEKKAGALRKAAPYLAGGGLAAAATYAGAKLLIGKKGRKRIKSEHRDPRLYSNLKGMLTGKSREERVKAHKKLPKGDGTILGAMKSGWTREKKAAFAKEAKSRYVKDLVKAWHQTGAVHESVPLSIMNKVTRSAGGQRAAKDIAKLRRFGKGGPVRKRVAGGLEAVLREGTKKFASERKEKLAHALDVVWIMHGMPDGIEKNAAAMHFEELRQEDRNQDAFGAEFCKLASSFRRDPWVLAQEVENQINAYEILAKTANDPRTRDLAAYYVEWANQMEKDAGLALLGRAAGTIARGVGRATGAVRGAAGAVRSGTARAARSGWAATRSGASAARGGVGRAAGAVRRAPGRALSAAKAAPGKVRQGYYRGRHGAPGSPRGGAPTSNAPRASRSGGSVETGPARASRSGGSAETVKQAPAPIQGTANPAYGGTAQGTGAAKATTQQAGQVTQQTGQAAGVAPQGGAAGAAEAAGKAAPFGGVNPAHIALGAGAVGVPGYLAYKAMSGPTPQNYQGGGYR